ncbi:MAG: stage III sporulation protein AD [Clostridiales bacterium]|nr:stage III sporulation protein AD [Clostridiales bacterium]
MEILKIILIGVITCVATIVLKNIKPELSILVSLAGGVVILVMVINSLTEIITNFSGIVNKTNVNTQLFSSVLKIVGVGYITEFGANICQDTGNSSIADKVLLAGKVIILCFALPIVNSMLNVIIGLIQ